MSGQAASGAGPEIQSISADEAFPLRRHHLRPGLPSEASRYPGDDDPAALHLGAFVDQQELVAVVSFLPRTERGDVDTGVYELQGMVTIPGVRNGGIGSILVQEGLTRLAARGAHRVWCDGRTPATSFYERLGFRAVGDEFITPATGPHYRFVIDIG